MRYDYAVGGSAITSSAITGLGSAFTISVPAYTITDVIVPTVYLIPDGDYTVVNHNSGLVMDVLKSSVKNGYPIVQASPTGSTSQTWHVANLGGNFITLTDKNSGQAAEVTYLTPQTGQPIFQWPINGGSNQIWQVVFANYTNGSYFLTNKHSALQLEVPGWSLTPGQALDQWSYYQYGANQQWQFH